MSFTKKEHIKLTEFYKGSESFFLGADVGGTNINIGIFGVKDKSTKLLISFHFKSKEVKGLEKALNEVFYYIQKKYNKAITNACIAVAGVLSQNHCFAKMTNSKWDVNKNVLLKKTKFKNIILLNDFEAVGYGINVLNKKDIWVIKKSEKNSKSKSSESAKASIVVIGAGTGLGKSTLLYNENSNSYFSIASEAGHSDFPAQNKYELELVNFIKKLIKTKNVSYEHLLSGKGINYIYLFLRNSKRFTKTKYTREIDASKSSKNQEQFTYLVSKYKSIDDTCKETFRIFKNTYAIFARNFALDALALGGVYIAGGIASKNKEIFDKDFIKTFEDNTEYTSILKRIPLYLILNCDVGLLGTGIVGGRVFGYMPLPIIE